MNLKFPRIPYDAHHDKNEVWCTFWSQELNYVIKSITANDLVSLVDKHQLQYFDVNTLNTSPFLYKLITDFNNSNPRFSNCFNLDGTSKSPTSFYIDNTENPKTNEACNYFDIFYDFLIKQNYRNIYLFIIVKNPYTGEKLEISDFGIGLNCEETNEPYWSTFGTWEEEDIANLLNLKITNIN